MNVLWKRVEYSRRIFRYPGWRYRLQACLVYRTVVGLVLLLRLGTMYFTRVMNCGLYLFYRLKVAKLGLHVFPRICQTITDHYPCPLHRILYKSKHHQLFLLQLQSLELLNRLFKASLLSLRISKLLLLCLLQLSTGLLLVFRILNELLLLLDSGRGLL